MSKKESGLFTETVCDICGEAFLEIDPDEPHYHQSVDLSVTDGMSYVDDPARTDYYDICIKCFREKIKPMIKFYKPPEF